MEINKEVSPLQIDGLEDNVAIREIALYVESQTSRMQGEIFALRQFLEVAVINNADTPNQEFNPLV